jgi:predicted transcriptional regulator
VSKPKITISFRLSPEILARLDALAEILKRPGREPIRRDAILAAIYEGLRTIEADPSVLRTPTPKTGARRSGTRSV